MSSIAQFSSSRTWPWEAVARPRSCPCMPLAGRISSAACCSASSA